MVSTSLGFGGKMKTDDTSEPVHIQGLQSPPQFLGTAERRLCVIGVYRLEGTRLVLVWDHGRLFLGMTFCRLIL